MIVVGVDPGKSGGLALLRQFVPGVVDILDVVKMPATDVDLWGWWRDLVAMPDFAVIERVHAMPRQGVTSTFAFGRSYGMLRMAAIAAEIPLEEVTPQKWQRAMGCLSKGDKNVTKARAQELYPKVKVTHAIADALLIATYGLRMLQGAH